MELFFLGTGAGMPAKERNVSAIVVRWDHAHHPLWLFDCGEGTQHQWLRSTLKLSRLTHIFITHLHGDHIFGLPGLLGSRSFQTQAPLTVYGPSGLRRWVETALEISGSHLTYPLEIIEITSGLVHADPHAQVEAASLDHGISCFGYRVVERDGPGRLNVERLAATGLPPGPLYAQLKAGQSVSMEDGRILPAADFVDPPTPGRRLAILGDTRPCAQAVELSRAVNVLVHEATFAAAERDLAHSYGHSTADEAANVARQAGVGHLWLTHVSARYTGNGYLQLETEAQAVFRDTTVAADFARVVVPRPSMPDPV